MSYIVVYGNKNECFENMSDLLIFLKDRYDKFERKMDFRNQLITFNNTIELSANTIHTYYIGVSKCNNQFELLKELYYEIGRCLGCFSEII